MMKLYIFETLKLTPDARPLAEFDLTNLPDGSILRLGSGKENNIVIANPNIASQHLELEVQAQEVFVRQLDKRKKVFLNDSKLSKANQQILLRPNDILRTGNSWLKLVEVTPKIAAEPASSIEKSLPTLPPEAVTLGGRSRAISLSLLWLYLLIVTVAEYVTAAVNPQVGLLIHVGLLIWLIWHGVAAQEQAERNLLLSLTIAPLIRLLSVSLPLVNLPQLAWYPLVAIPLLLAAVLIIRQIGLSRLQLGLRTGYLPLQLLVVGAGFGLGAIEYFILRPAPLVKNLSLDSLVLPGLNLLVFTGFNEEIIFRGLLLATALPVLKRWSPLYVSLLFAVLHIGYLSLIDVIFVFGVGLLFAYIVCWSGSILGVTLIHGLANTTLFLLMPYIMQQTDQPQPLIEIMSWLTWSGSFIAIVAVMLMALNARPSGTISRLLKLDFRSLAK